MTTTAVGNPVDIKRATELFTDTKFFGAAEINEAFGLKVLNSEDVPPIPLTIEQLGAARKFGVFLIYEPPRFSIQRICGFCENKTRQTGKNLIMGYEGLSESPICSDESEAGAWYLFSPPIHDSTALDYPGQTLLLAKFAATFFSSIGVPNLVGPYEQVLQALRSIEQKMPTHPRAAFDLLMNLQVNKLFRPSPRLIVLLLALHERVNCGQRLFEHFDCWTNAVIEACKIGATTEAAKRALAVQPVAVGGFRDAGINIYSHHPWRTERVRPTLGTCFAWRVSS